MGSKVQRGAPVRTSKAKMVPGEASLRMLSVMAEPSATTPLTTTGAEMLAGDGDTALTVL